MSEAPLLRGRQLRRGAAHDAEHRGGSPRRARAGRNLLGVQRRGDSCEAHPSVSAVPAAKRQDAFEDRVLARQRPERLHTLTAALVVALGLTGDPELADEELLVELSEHAL